MKKLLLILPLIILFFLGCEEDPTIDEIFTGTWKVSNMGLYANDDCSGALDYTEFGMMQSYGFTMTFVFHDDGTIDMTMAGMGETDTESGVWTATEDELCIDGDCIDYTLSDGDKTLEFEDLIEASCEDENYVEYDLDQMECEDSGYYWSDPACIAMTLTKQ